MTHILTSDWVSASSSICDKCEVHTYVLWAECLCNLKHSWCEKCWKEDEGLD